jgi:hypothetical protein
MIIWSWIYFIHFEDDLSQYTQDDFNHPLGVVMYALLGIQICFMKIVNHLCAQISMDIKLWPT